MDMRRRDLPARPLPSHGASNGASNGMANGPQQAAPRPLPPGTTPRPLTPGAAPRPMTPSTTPRPMTTAPARPGAPAPMGQGAAAARPGVSSPASGGGYATSARPSNKVEDLLQAIRQLTDLLTKENAALKKHRFEDVKTFTERKEQLARLYQGHMNAIHRDATPLKMLDAARRESLAHQAMRLGELMQENASLLKANITSINMYFKAVTDAVREREEKRAAAYSRQGAMNGYIAKRSLAVTFNQTL